MKSLFNWVKDKEKHFTGNGKLKNYSPVYDAFSNFLFGTAKNTHQGPHVRDNLDTKRVMLIVIVSLLPCTLFGIYNAGLQALMAAHLDLSFFSIFSRGFKIVLPIILVSYVVGGFWEVLFSVIRKRKINEGLSVTALLFSLTLPPTIPLWQVAIGMSFGIVVAKEIFGGTGRNFLNPALTARAFLFFAFPAQLTGEVWTTILVSKERIVDGFSGATPLAIAALVKTPDSVTAVLNEAGFSLSNTFWGYYPGSIGETSIFAIILGAILLIATRIANWRTIAGCIVGLMGMALLFNLFSDAYSLPFMHLGPFRHLFMGGFAFGAVFMATDPVSSPMLNNSKWIYGIFIGMITVIIRVANPAYPEGIMLAILLMNIVAPLLDQLMMRRNLAKRIPHVI